MPAHLRPLEQSDRMKEASPVSFLAARRPSTAFSQGSGSRGLGVSQTGLGRILTDDRGFALYTWDQDDPDVSHCYESCAAQFPPLNVSGHPQDPGAGGKIGVTTRAD